MIRLTDEENPYPDDPREHMRGGVHTAFNAGTKAQLKKVVELLKSKGKVGFKRNTEIDIDDEKAFEPYGFFIKFSDEEWQALLEEVKDA